MQAEKPLPDKATCQCRHVCLRRPDNNPADMIVKRQTHKPSIAFKVQAATNGVEYVVVSKYHVTPPLFWVAG